MKQVNTIETIFVEGSLTDQLNAVEATLLRGGRLSADTECHTGTFCDRGTKKEKVAMIN
jgi:hypothetical protein